MEAQYIIVHTSAWPGDPSADEIDQYHRSKGWKMIGYHYVIRKSGLVEPGRNEGMFGAHCRDMGMNRKSLGLVFSGHHDNEHWTDDQWTAMKRLFYSIHWRKGIPVDKVLGHRETGANKSCPGDKINMNKLRHVIGMYLKNSTTAPIP